MLNRLLVTTLFFSTFALNSKIATLNFSDIQKDAKHLESYNHRVKLARKALHYTSIAAVTLAAGYLSIQAKDWFVNKRLELGNRPFDLEYVKLFTGWSRIEPHVKAGPGVVDNAKNYFSGVSKETVKELSDRIKPLEEEQKRFFEKMLLNAGATYFIKDYTVPAISKALEFRDLNWAFKGLNEDFYNSKISSVNVSPNSAVISELSTIKLDASVYQAEAALEALNRGAQAHIYIDGASVSEEALALKLKAAASKRLMSGDVPESVRNVFVEAFEKNITKANTKVSNIASVLLNNGRQSDAETVVKFANEFITTVNNGLDFKSEFDLLVYVVAYENGINSIYASIK